MTPPVVGGVPSSARFDGDPPQEEVEVVLEGDTDAAVDLDAVVQQLGAVVADEGLGHARPARRRRGVAGRRRPRPASAMAWLASSQVFMSAKRCLSSW